MKKAELAAFMTHSFNHGIGVRELRLSQEEVALLQKDYPTAIVKKGGEAIDVDGRSWYEVMLGAEASVSAERLRYDEVHSLRQENEALLRELLSTKQQLHQLRQQLHALQIRTSDTETT